MADERTRKSPRAAGADSFEEFVARWQPSLVIVAGGPEGADYQVELPCLTVGRGPGVDLEFEDDEMSRRHAALEYADGSLRIRDLGSTNGVRVNDGPVSVRELEHGDRVQLGGLVFRYLLEERKREPRTYVLPEA